MGSLGPEVNRGCLDRKGMREQEASRDPLVPSVFRYVALCLCSLSFHLLRTSFSAGCKTKQNVGTGLTLRAVFLICVSELQLPFYLLIFIFLERYLPQFLFLVFI